MAESRIARAWERLRNFVAPTPEAGEIAIGDTRRWPSLASAMIGDWVPYNPDDLAITKGGLRIYDKMREDDQVKACLWITKAAIIGPGWILEPGDKTGAAQDLAETITDTLEHLEGPRTFDDSIAEVLTAADYGFSICEKVYAVDDTGLHLSALKGRAPHQIDFKQDAFDNIEAILQQQGGTRLQMDPSRFVHFMNQPEFGNPYGRSMLREAYTSWWYKRNIQQWWAQFMEKLAIPPVYGKYGATEKPNAPHVLEVLKRLQAGTALTVAEPWELGLLETTRDPRATFEAAVDHFNLGIARACLLFDKSGLAGRNVQQGSHALAQTQFDVWVLVVGSMQRRLCKCLQEQLIDELAEFEAPGVAPPALRFLPLTDRNKEAIANLWIQAVMNGAALTTIEDENHLRDMLEFPERQADARDAAKMQAAIAMPTPAPKSGGGGSSNTGGDGVPNAPQSTTPIPKPPTANMAQHVCECPPIPMAFAAGNIEGLAAHLAKKYGTDHPFSDCMDADELGGYDVEARRAICGRVKALALEAKGGEPAKHAEVGAFWRPLDPLEKRADMAESRRQTLTLSEKHGPVIAKAIGALVDDVKKRAAKLPPSAAAIRQLAPTKRLQNELSDAVSAMMSDGYAGGQRKAATEIRAAKRAPAKFSETQTNVLAAFEARGGLVGSRATQFFANKALFVTGLTVDDILKRAQLVLFNSLKQDKTPGQVMFEVDQALGDYLPEEDAAGNVVNVPARVETIVNTNLAEAWNEGRWAAFTDPDLEGFISMVRYSAVMDDRTRATHAAWDGVTRPVDDPVWFGPPDERPPNGYNCRCTLVPISVADNAEETPDDALPSEPAADTNFK